MTDNQKQFLFLAACARIKPEKSEIETIAKRADWFSDWKWLIPAVKTHGLGPLVLQNLSQAKIRIPVEIKKKLIGLTLHTRQANTALFAGLEEILAIFSNENIDATLLKGSALASLIYPDISLRPMGDVDLFVSQSNIVRAQAILAELGFHAPCVAMVASGPIKHLFPATRLVGNNLQVVELHCRLAKKDLSPLLSEPGIPVTVSNSPSHTLGATAMFVHIGHHLQTHLQHYDPWKFIWMADLVAWAQKYDSQINWGQIAKKYPKTLNMLALARCFSDFKFSSTCLPPLKNRTEKNLGIEYTGWPAISLQKMPTNRHRRWSLLKKTLFPALWPLIFHYGLSPDQKYLTHPWLLHYAELARRVFHETHKACHKKICRLKKQPFTRPY